MKRVYHLFIRSKRRSFLYCGTAHPVSIVRPQSGGDGDEGIKGIKGIKGSQLVCIQFQLLSFFTSGLFQSEDYLDLLRRHVDELSAEQRQRRGEGAAVSSEEAGSGQTSPI